MPLRCYPCPRTPVTHVSRTNRGLGWGSTGGFESLREPPPSSSAPRDRKSAAPESHARRATLSAPRPARVDLRAVLHPARLPACVRCSRSRRCTGRSDAGGETAHLVDAAADAPRVDVRRRSGRGAIAVLCRAGESVRSWHKTRTRKRRGKQTSGAFSFDPHLHPPPKHGGGRQSRLLRSRSLLLHLARPRRPRISVLLKPENSANPHQQMGEIFSPLCESGRTAKIPSRVRFTKPSEGRRALNSLPLSFGGGLGWGSIGSETVVNL